MIRKIFLSHSSEDRRLVNEFIGFLQMGMNVNPDEIYCTSLKGTIPTGVSFINDIKDNITQSEAVIFFMTQAYMNSKFCLAELGAAWALNQNIYPVLVNPITYGDLGHTPLSGIQAIKLDEEEDLAVLYTEFQKKGLAKNNTIRFNRELRAFQEEIHNKC